MSKPTIGFIGLGLMGAAMVECLQENGYPMVVIANRSRTAIDAAVARGATEATSTAELAAASDIVMLCVDTTANVESRIYGDDGVLAGIRPGSVVIDFGTSIPDSTRKIGADLAEKGATYLDAPLGRTPAHAKKGQLNIMCSGDKEAFDKVKPVLDVLGENVFHLGALGTGHTIKLINNFFAMTTASAMAEAFGIADRSGIEREKLYNVMSSGPLHSGMMDFIKSYAVDGQIDLAFSINNGLKDVGYFREMSDALGAPSKIARGTAETLKEVQDGGQGDLMVPQLIDFLTRDMK
ncbi:NAD(P)-dependent oxidoreductase [Aliiruegeria sabulilitoris]|uniref:NAD(P)-dependent oxidoreductase n=1 Tax=Aliiruegeria sabulilitoris TaxID=1510458 RepID=UPI0008356A7D|nr:NAD(P)-dependent oxidoreductase [Aliiruegeria sabulilitoris]NDR55785.1 NAD(P)-dependent oxidoreductase [Pseudoruegeria sp. M32A2M]